MSNFCNTQFCIEESLSFGFTPVILEGKIPIEKKYNEKYRSITREALLKEASRRNGSNVGILLTNNILCIDVDLQQSGFQNWEDILVENNIDDPDDIDTAIVRTGSGGRHYYFTLTPDLEDCQAYLKNKNAKVTGIDVKRNGHLVYPGSVYPGCGKTHKCGARDPENCLFRGKSYRWIKRPDIVKIAPIPDWLRKYIVTPYKAKREEEKKESIYSPDLIRASFERLKSRADVYHEWRDMIWCLRAIGCDIEIAHEFSKLSKKYDPDSVDELWDSYDPSKASWSLTTIFQWLKEDMNEEEYIEFCNLYLQKATGTELVLEGDWGLSKIFIDNIQTQLKLTDSKGHGYLYNPDTKLWEKVYPEFLCNVVSETLRPILKQIVDQVTKKDKINNTHLVDFYKGALYRALTSSGASGILRQSLRKLVDFSFIKKLNRTLDLLPIKNGKVINLKTLEVRDRVEDDYFSVECPVEYKPSDSYPIAEEFFLGICKQDVEYVEYLRRLLAYFLTGAITDRRFYIFVGSGMNGKSTLIKLMELMLGDLYKSLSDSVIIGQDKHSSCTPELVPLLHCRLGVLPENRENVSLHSEKLKAFTGDDTLVCRPLYMEEFNFETQAKLVLMTNHLPQFNGSDKAMVERVVVLPFHAVFSPNPGYKDKLISNLDEIFSYIISKSKEFWEEKRVTKLPQVVIDEINRYTKENDVIGMFIEQCCILDPTTKTQAALLYESYKQWCDFSRIYAIDSKKFFKALEKSFLKCKTKTCMKYQGIAIKPIVEDVDE